MKMWILFSTIFYSSALMAQEIFNSEFSTFSSIESTSTISIEASGGEILYEGGENSILTIVEGSIQPKLILDIGTDEYLNLYTVNIHPNPTSDRLKVVSFNNVLIQISLYDSTGKLLNRFEESETFDIDLSDYSSGNYLLKVSLVDQTRDEHTFKVIKL
ncbi:MAG: T9SS type A sorting domain-containing protein [Carboxylicivirga sp.]|nr:T9SS type A sorting domain-containing protein [Carboxylicivirga sp.]